MRGGKRSSVGAQHRRAWAFRASRWQGAPFPCGPGPAHLQALAAWQPPAAAAAVLVLLVALAAAAAAPRSAAAAAPAPRGRRGRRRVGGLRRRGARVARGAGARRVRHQLRQQLQVGCAELAPAVVLEGVWWRAGSGRAGVEEGHCLAKTGRGTQPCRPLDRRARRGAPGAPSAGLTAARRCGAPPWWTPRRSRRPR
jgi:hypothetical protein